LRWVRHVDVNQIVGIRSVTGVVIAGTIIANGPWPEERVAGWPV